jgi:hypothetical protein
MCSEMLKYVQRSTGPLLMIRLSLELQLEEEEVFFPSSHPFPCPFHCAPAGPHSASLLFRYCSAPSPPPALWPSSTDVVASAGWHPLAPCSQGSDQGHQTRLSTCLSLLQCCSRLPSPNTPTLGSEPRPSICSCSIWAAW